MRRKMIYSMLCCLMVVMLIPATGYSVAHFGSWINGFVPSKGPNATGVTIRVIGDFKPPIEQVSLRDDNGTEIVGTVTDFAENAYLIDWEGSTSGDIITVTFNLVVAPLGDYQVIVEDDLWPIAADALFTVGPATDADLWASISGQSQVRGGATTHCYIWYGNRGNAASLPSGILLVGIPKNLEHELAFNLDDYALPGVDILSITGTDPLDAQFDSLLMPTEFEATFDGKDYRILSLYIQDIPPLSNIPLKITVTWDVYDWSTVPQVDHLLKVWWAGGKPDDYQPTWPAN